MAKKVKTIKRSLVSWFDRIRKSEKKHRDDIEEIKRWEKDLWNAIFRGDHSEISSLRGRIKKIKKNKKK